MTELLIKVATAPPGAAAVSLEGELDFMSAPPLDDRLRELLTEQRPKRLTIGMSGVTFMDSSGANTLVRLWEYAQRMRCVLTLSRPQPIVETLLTTMGVAGMLGVTPTVTR